MMFKKGGVHGLIDLHIGKVQPGEIVVVFIDRDRFDDPGGIGQLQDDFLDDL